MAGWGAELGGYGREGVGEGFGVQGWGGWGRWGGGDGVVVDVVFETHPGDEGGAEGEVEEAFVGDG